MTVTVPTSVELADSPCSVAECLETAQLMGSATVRVNPGVGAPPDFETLTVGLPQYSATPTWMFFRNTLLSDLFFTLVFVACMNLGRKASGARAGAALPRVA